MLPVLWQLWIKVLSTFACRFFVHIILKLIWWILRDPIGTWLLNHMVRLCLALLTLIFIISFCLLWVYFSFIFFPGSWNRINLRLLFFITVSLSAVHFLFSTILDMSHKFWYIIFSFSFNRLKSSFETSSFTHELFKNMLVSFQVFENFLIIFLFLISRMKSKWG